MAAPGNLPAPNKLNVYQASAQYRQQLLAREQATVDDFVRRYIIARDQITRELDAMVRRVEAAQAQGKVPVVLPYGGQFGPNEYSASWLYRVGRLDRLAATIEGEIGQYSETSLEHVRKRASAEAITGGQDAGQLLKFRVRDDGLVVPRQFAELPEGALAQIIAFSGPGGPHPKAFRDMGPELVRQVQQRLVDGLAKGTNPREIAAKMQRDTQHGGILDRPLYEQMRVARTEPLRAYRESSRATYQANVDVVASWEWRAFPGPRTCAYCLAMDGSVHSVDEVMATHPQCRCTSLPRTAYSPEPAFTGAQYLYNLSPEEQDEVFGSHTMGELYRRGKFQLGDMVEQYQHPDWGQVGRAASMRSLEARGIITRQDIVEARAAIAATRRPVWAFNAAAVPNVVPIVQRPAPPAPAPAPAPPAAPPAQKPPKARSRPIQTRTTAAQPAPPPNGPKATAEQVAKAWRPLGADGRSGVNTTGVAEVAGEKFIVKILDSTISGSLGEYAAAEVAEHMGVARLLPESYEAFSKQVAKAMGQKDVYVAKFEDGLDSMFAQVYEKMDVTNQRPHEVLAAIARGDREDIVLFDFVIGNGDRHGQNVLGDLATGRMLLIDHERAFQPLSRLDSYHFMVENDMDAEARADKMEFTLSRAKVQRIVDNADKIIEAAGKRYLVTAELEQRINKLRQLLEDNAGDLELGDLYR
jgi:SPP1 gp7 family putative phage head morphogenesis protein